MMRWGKVFLVLVGLLLASAEASAMVCQADDLCDPNAPACEISSAETVGDACVLDFGARPLTVTGNLSIEFPGASFTITAGDVTLQSAKLKGKAGDIAVFAAGVFRATGGTSGMDVNSGDDGGFILVDAASIQLENGSLTANGSNGSAGGSIDLASTGAISSAANLSATGTGEYDGGEVLIASEGSIDVLEQIQASGGGNSGTGGEITLEAEGSISVQARLVSTGGGEDGGGGTISMISEDSISIQDKLDVRGTDSLTFGGDIVLEAARNLTVQADLDSRGGGGEAGGGAIDLFANGQLHIAPGATLNVNAGETGGSIITGGVGQLLLEGDVVARGTAAGLDPSGGDITLGSHCSITISGSVDSGANGTLGSAGFTELVGGTIDVASGAQLLSLPCSGGCNLVRLRSIAGTFTKDTGAIIDPPEDLSNDPNLSPCCGNAASDPGEECDEGDALFCDGCDRNCQVESDPPCPSDGNVCTQDCNPVRGCTFEPIQCIDGVDCTIDSCDPNSGCFFTPDDDTCSGDQCHQPICDPQLGCMEQELPNGSACGEFCQPGHCIAGICETTPRNCNDSNPCTEDLCFSDFGLCLNIERPEDCPCEAGGIPEPAGTPCVDGQVCTIGDVCDGAGGCVSGAAPDCDDGNPCTFDFCGQWGCQYTGTRESCPVDCTGEADGTPCNTGQPCTSGTCLNELCVSDPQNCGDDDACNGDDFCDFTFGCRMGFPEADGFPCDNGDQCSLADTCQAGTCAAGLPKSCSDGIFCNGEETCDSQLGCQAGTPPDPNDGNLCTLDFCDEETDLVQHVCDVGQPCGVICSSELSCQQEGEECRCGLPGISCADEGGDADGDLICQDRDNCLTVPNTFQQDVDRDGYGNICDCDFDQTGVCDVIDHLTLLLCRAGTPVPPDPECRESDMNSDGSIDDLDLEIFEGMLDGVPGPAAGQP